MRRARVQVLRKLVRQSKTLRLKKGDDKQLEKYKRKADKLGEELVIMKKIPDDEVTRYSITNDRRLEEVLNDPKSDPETCVLARLASHKIIINRVAEFKKKFPNFADHLGPGRKKLYKLKRKAGKLAGKEAKSNPEKEAEESLGEENEEPEASGELKTDVKSDDGSPERKRAKILPKKSKPADKLSGIKPTSKESTVKSLTSFLEENGDVDSKDIEETEERSKIVLEKEVDSFFMTEDGGGEYLSVVVPKLKPTEEEEGDKEPSDGNDWKNSSRSRNNRFFDKVDTREDKFRRRDDKGDKFREKNRPPGFGKRDRDFKSVAKTEEKEMHPSWAAKKKEQDVLKLGFQGKKIVFDDL